MDFEIKLIFLIERFFLHDQKVMTKALSLERKELLSLVQMKDKMVLTA